MSSPVKVYAIASLLNLLADKATHELWQQLEWDCGLKGIRLTPTPHFSWQGAEGYDHPEVKILLERLVEEMKPFRVRTSGIGIFTAPYPVIYLPIVKNRQLLEFHEQLHRLVSPFAHRPNRYYSPDYWIPHITLANRDVTSDKICCAINGLVFQPLDIEIIVDHLVMIYSIDDQVGMNDRFDFKKKEVRNE